jgi:DNA topoisomerase-1
MQVAQRLYEGIDIGGETTGLITYMRTDGVQMAPSAIDAGASAIGEEFGAICAEKPRSIYDQGQERPGSARSDPPDRLVARPACAAVSIADQSRLYELIWKRTIASQMESAEMERTTVDIAARQGARACSACAPPVQVVKFDGFLAAYTDQKEDDDDEDEDSRRLPEIHERR